MTDVVVERLASPADLDGVLAIEAASFNNPTTREWYERELKRPEVCFIYVLRTAGPAGRRVLRLLARRRADSHQ